MRLQPAKRELDEDRAAVGHHAVLAEKEELLRIGIDQDAAWISGGIRIEEWDVSRKARVTAALSVEELRAIGLVNVLHTVEANPDLRLDRAVLDVADHARAPAGSGAAAHGRRAGLRGGVGQENHAGSGRGRRGDDAFGQRPRSTVLREGRHRHEDHQCEEHNTLHHSTSATRAVERVTGAIRPRRVFVATAARRPTAARVPARARPPTLQTGCRTRSAPRPACRT